MNLKEQIKNIYDFVNLEFDIEDKEELEGIKKGLSIDKIDTLDKMLKDYNKQVIKLKRAEQQRQAQKAYKKIGTNLKLEEYNKYATIAEIDKISISEFCKKALERFIEPKTVSSEEIAVKNELEALKGNYEALKSTNEGLISSITELKKNNEKLEPENENLKNRVKYLEPKNIKLVDTVKSLNEKLDLLNETNKNYADLSFIDKIVKAFKK